MFSLLPCVETLKVMEIFVERYCINCKGIEKKYILAYFDVIANETGERKREPVSAAGYRAVGSSRAMQKKSQIFQVDFRVIRFRQ